MRSRLLQLLLPPLLLPCLTGPSPHPAAAEPASQRRIDDIVYGREDGLALTLDPFVPEKPNSASLLFLVNGGWLSSKATPLMG